MAAEIGIAASLIQIAGAGIQLTRTLYEFGSTTSAAQEQVEYIGKNVSYYSDVLELLVEQFEHDRPIHSRKATDLAERLYDHSYDLFDRIRDLIPVGRRARDQISFLQRIAWNFKKTKVDLLVGELEKLKTTVQLLVQVLCAARQIWAYKEDSRKPEQKTQKHDAVRRQYLRAENGIFEWQKVQERLPALQEAAERDDVRSIQAGPGPGDTQGSSSLKSPGALIKSQEITLSVIEAATANSVESHSGRRALVLQKTSEWLEQLIEEWTVLSQEPVEKSEVSNCNLTTEWLRGDSRPAPKTTSTGRGEEPKPTALGESQQRLDTPKAPIGFTEVELGQEGERAGRRPQNLGEEAQQNPTVRIPTKTRPEGPSSIVFREYPGGRIYEERVPSSSYFEEGNQYQEEEPRTTSRKYDGYEWERRPEFRQPEKEKKNSKGPEKAANDLPFNIAQKLKVKAEKTREIIKEKAREKEASASNAKSRDREQRRERMDKQSSRRPYVEDDYSSDSDTVTHAYASINRPRPRTSKSAYDSVPRTKPKPEPPRRSTSRREEDEDEEEDIWHSYHRSAREYLERSQRPSISGRTSSSRSYWEPMSDSDKRPRSSKVTIPSLDIPKTHPPW